MDVVGVLREFKGSENSNDRYGITRVVEVRLHLPPNFLHHLGYVV